MKEEFSVITFAVNKLSYLQFALNCAQSVLIHNSIPVFIVTNLEYTIPMYFQNKVFIIPAKPEHTSLGIGMKLYIDEYVQTKHTLFIDADCLCFGSLNEIFKACDKLHVSVAGNVTALEDWCGDSCVVSIKKNFNLHKIIKFNGGLYYIKNSSLAKAIFEKAREIADNYEFGFDKIKGKWVTEELVISISMMLNNQQSLPDNGYFMTDFYTDQRPAVLNVLKGLRVMNNPQHPCVRHRPWYPKLYSPIILHFGGGNYNSYPYKSQKILLNLYRMHFSIPLASMFVYIFIHLPYKSYHWLRECVKKNT